MQDGAWPGVQADAPSHARCLIADKLRAIHRQLDYYQCVLEASIIGLDRMTAISTSHHATAYYYVIFTGLRIGSNLLFHSGGLYNNVFVRRLKLAMSCLDGFDTTPSVNGGVE